MDSLDKLSCIGVCRLPSCQVTCHCAGTGTTDPRCCRSGLLTGRWWVHEDPCLSQVLFLSVQPCQLSD